MGSRRAGHNSSDWARTHTKRDEEHVIWKWRRGDPCYNVAKNLADLYSNVVESRTCEWWTILAEEISKQSITGVTWFLLAAYSKMWEDKDRLKKELLSKRESELDDLQNSWPIPTAINDKACPSETPSVCLHNHLWRGYSCDTQTQINLSVQKLEQRCGSPGGIQENLLACWLGTLEIAWVTNKVFDNFIPAENLPA